MTLKEAIEKIGGDYDEVMGRLPMESLVIKLMGKFLADDSLEKLKTAVETSDYQSVFAVTHNLKGVCANLGMEALRAASSELCEATRNGAPTVDIGPMYEEIKEKYDLAKEVIRELTA